MFFRTDAGSEPVRDWLKHHVSQATRKTIGTDIKTVQATWPIGKPLVASLGHAMWEVRSAHDGNEYRVVFTLDENTMILLHAFKKTTRKTRRGDIDIALARRASRERSR